MPTYEYLCNKCKYITTEIKMIAERNNCPKCEECSEETKLIISKVNSKINRARQIRTESSDPGKHTGYGRDPEDVDVSRTDNLKGAVPASERFRNNPDMVKII